MRFVWISHTWPQTAECPSLAFHSPFPSFHSHLPDHRREKERLLETVPQRTESGASELAAQLATLTAEDSLASAPLSPLLQNNPRECALRGRSVSSSLASSKGVGAAGSPGQDRGPAMTWAVSAGLGGTGSRCEPPHLGLIRPTGFAQAPGRRE